MRVRFGVVLGVAALGAVAGCAGGDEPSIGDEDQSLAAASPAGSPGPSAAEAARMDAYLKSRLDRAGVVATLQTTAGRRVDCVDMLRQPAVKNLGLAKLEAPPTLVDGLPPEDAGSARVVPEALFDLTGKIQSYCPTGTVPIPEVTRADLNRFSSLDEFFAKNRAPTVPPTRAAATDVATDVIAPPHVGPTANHQYAYAYRWVTNWGAETSISIPSQTTELNSEFSLGQIWVVAGSGAGTQTLEGGIQHYRDLYGDFNPHLFIYSTRGNYAPGTGCYNNTCGDFVQVSSTWFPAMVLGPVSVPGGAQYSVNFHWAKAGDTGSWWLSVNGEWMGYYPRALYTAAINHAALIEYGGEIIDNRNGGRHTMTDMGTGSFASAGWTWAAYMRTIRFNDSNPSGSGITWAEATGLTATQDDAACYSISLVNSTDPVWHTYFWYGGPGYSNPGCL